jgi:hypothetical protein
MFRRGSSVISHGRLRVDCVSRLSDRCHVAILRNSFAKSEGERFRFGSLSEDKSSKVQHVTHPEPPFIGAANTIRSRTSNESAGDPGCPPITLADTQGLDASLATTVS